MLQKTLALMQLDQQTLEALVESIVYLIILAIAIVLVMIFLYLTVRLLAGKKETDMGYIVRLLIVSICIVLIVAVVVGAVAGALAGAIAVFPIIGPAIGTALIQIAPVVAFVVIVYLIKLVLIPEVADTRQWFISIWATVVCLFLVFLLNALANILFGVIVFTPPTP